MIAFFPKHHNRIWLFVALVVAFALRVYLLDAQSLWNDEGNSIALAPLSLEAIANAAAHDIHPPLYYFILHFWIPFAGITEYAIRLLSVIAGVLTVAVTFRIARVFFDEQIAIIAAYLSALSPFQVYYSQETRMYIWVTLFASVSVLAVVRMLEIGSWKLEVGRRDSKNEIPSSNRQPPNSRTRRTLAWLVYIVSTIAMLYTQYVGVFIIVAENLAFAVWLWLAWRERQLPSLSKTGEGRGGGLPRRGSIRHSVFFWVAAQVIVGVTTVPWYLAVREQIAGWPSISDALDLPTLLWRVLNVFSVGLTMTDERTAAVALAFGILFLLGWRIARTTHANWGIATLIAWTLVPVAAMYLVSLARPAYNPKFLLLATPAFYILAAKGFAQVTIRVRYAALGDLSFLVCALIVLFGSLVSLDNYYANPQFARDDYRSILRFTDANARAGDSILIDAPGQIDVVRYYHRGDQSLFLLPRMRPPDPAVTRADVDAMIAKSQRLFAIYYATEQSDPQNIIGERLAQRAFLARDEWHGNIRFALYGIAPATRAAPQSLDAKFGDEIVLTRYQLDTRTARAGDVLTLTLNWRAERTPFARYKVFVHLLATNDQVVAQRDAEPVNNQSLTTTWRAGENITDNYGIFVEPGTPTGDYRIEIGMYRADDGARLRVGDADHLIIGTVKVE
ncbi:hypothetical protein ANRL1_02435 [Anaerolineae bacterium]|nr:hypothetical protein ANRL1_02435 [Anaerolineae bacterium]